jgi:leader peptidase (prepilin peptidase)/N-methyltransferase
VIPDAVWAVLAGLFGLAIGSFLNVVIYRVPANESVVRPASKCPSCGAAIRSRHNVPVVGWLVLRGKCYDCKAPISWRYPLIELVTGLLFAAVTARLVHLHLGWAVPAYLYFAAIGVALTMIDIDHKRLPNSIVMPSYLVVAALLAIASTGTGDWDALARAGIGGILAYLSWRAFAVGAFGGFLLGAVGGIVVLATRRGNRKTEIPFGPYMIVATLVAIFVANPLTDAYLDLLNRN